ncbi:MAG: hypothetical protein D6795_10945 [Deltaproteobacteria bacterium]|nr:MAG: hypothetical protein D6795_10945 [Deltaproteobacteria bacterium]
MAGERTGKGGKGPIPGSFARRGKGGGEERHPSCRIPGRFGGDVTLRGRGGETPPFRMPGDTLRVHRNAGMPGMAEPRPVGIVCDPCGG